MNLQFLDRTLELALRAIGHTWPNPLVGAVLVKNGHIMGEGFHQKYGGPHAEIMAIQDFFKNGGSDLSDATLYCSLEPCCHSNKQTPPCVGEIIKNKIQEVVVIAQDPNPQVAGQGLRILNQAGIKTSVIPHRLEEYQQINAPFWMAMTQKRPYVHGKWAQTLDGKMARVNGDSKWLTSEAARAAGHYLRGTHQAILVGGQTVIKDNPSLNVRYQWEGKFPAPLRVVVQGQAPLPMDAHVLTNHDQKTLIIRTLQAPAQKWSSPHIEVVSVEANHNHQIDPEEILKILFERKIISLLIEGGPKIFSSFLNLDLIDEMSVFIAAKIFGDGLAPGDDLVFSHLKEFIGIQSPHWTNFGPDMLMHGRPYRVKL